MSYVSMSYFRVILYIVYIVRAFQKANWSSPLVINFLILLYRYTINIQFSFQPSDLFWQVNSQIIVNSKINDKNSVYNITDEVQVVHGNAIISL